MSGLPDLPMAFAAEISLEPGNGVMELPLLLSTEQVLQLEDVARRHGLTVGQMLRRLIYTVLEASRNEFSSAACIGSSQGAPFEQPRAGSRR